MTDRTFVAVLMLGEPGRHWEGADMDRSLPVTVLAEILGVPVADVPDRFDLLGQAGIDRLDVALVAHGEKPTDLLWTKCCHVAVRSQAVGPLCDAD